MSLLQNNRPPQNGNQALSGSRSPGGTVGKALDLLALTAEFRRPVRFSELCARSTYPKATVHRLLQTLTRQRMLAFNSDDHTYSLGLRLVRLAHAAWEQASLAPVARPFIDDLSNSIGETVHLAQLDSGHVLYVDKRNAADPVEMFSESGRIGPAYCTGVGKAMLAFLNKSELDEALREQSFRKFTSNTIVDEAALRRELATIQGQGYACDNEEHEPGIVCVAAPILSPARRVLGAVSVTATTRLSNLEELSKLTPWVKRTADLIAEEAVSWQYPEQTPTVQRAGAT
ncbi:MAG: IclR family transcriptional regulator [Rhodobacteraceae bacterium]|nr:IclR family transcriptional regulator [Paracoccaceae bacterium]MCY4195652.1 IclR family transcriptional regulator [Paracoccaceae bacterium]MCY4326396.1 IclR family transcriptional regulator [Paracoccaceae bacterium]